MPLKRRIRAIGIALTVSLVVTLFAVDYTVQRGDTLGQIAKENGVSVKELLEVNDIDDPNLIYPGQVIIIPGKAGEPDRVHVVARGETLNRIASKYETAAGEIASANGLANPNLIYPGQKLLIPSPGTTGSTPPGQPSTTPSKPGTYYRSGKFHSVKKGESLDSIAGQYQGVTGEDIARANGIVNRTIYSGTRLFLDGPGYLAKGSPGETSYTVKKGDRLGDIAAAHDTSVATIASANGISNPNFIRSGQILKIPTGSAWVCPVEVSSFFNDWGFPRGGGSRYHEGNDLFATQGVAVRAPVSGTVEFIVGTVGGNQFNLVGDDGVVYLGSHMERFEGKSRKVKAGEVMGYVGTTGNAVGTRPHLHFGMYISGFAVNPDPTLVEQGCK